MAVRCSWCQKEDSRIAESSLEAKSGAQYICADCLLPLLPMQLEATPAPASAQATAEQRRAQREILFSQVYIASLQQGKRVGPALILDISASGMRIQIGYPLAMGASIVIGFFGQSEIYKYDAEVVYTRTVGVAESTRFEVGMKLLRWHKEARPSS